MKAHHLLPALLLVLGGAAAPASAQELGLTFGGERGHVRAVFGAHGASIELSAYDRRSRGYERGYERHRRGRDVRRDDRHVCVTRPIWVPGHHETRERRVWVPGFQEKVWIEPVYTDAVDSCGRRTRHLVRAGRWEIVEHPGHYETRCEQVWIPGRYELQSCCAR